MAPCICFFQQSRKINNITGAVYIGSYINIGSRLVDVENNTNEHLQYAINHYKL